MVDLIQNVSIFTLSELVEVEKVPPFGDVC